MRWASGSAFSFGSSKLSETANNVVPPLGDDPLACADESAEVASPILDIVGRRGIRRRRIFLRSISASSRRSLPPKASTSKTTKAGSQRQTSARKSRPTLESKHTIWPLSISWTSSSRSMNNAGFENRVREMIWNDGTRFSVGRSATPRLRQGVVAASS